MSDAFQVHHIVQLCNANLTYNSSTVGLQSSCVYYCSESYSVTFFFIEKLPIKLAKTAMVFYLLSNRGKALD